MDGFEITGIINFIQCQEHRLRALHTYKGMKNVDDLFDDNIATCVTLASPEVVLMTTLEADTSCVNTSRASKGFYFTMCATHTSVSKTKRQDDYFKNQLFQLVIFNLMNRIDSR